MLEMAILDIQIFKIFCGSMPPDPPRKLAPLALVGVRPPPPRPSFQNPGSAPANVNEFPHPRAKLHLICHMQIKLPTESVCARLAQLARSLMANQKVPGSSKEELNLAQINLKT